jgi:hypothetical protein
MFQRTFGTSLIPKSGTNVDATESAAILFVDCEGDTFTADRNTHACH